MTNYFLNEDRVFVDVNDGIAIVIDSETGVYYGMNSFGTEIYENLVNGVSVEDILKTIKPWKTNIEDDYNKFLKFITQNHIMYAANIDSPAIQINIDKKIAKKDNFIPEIIEYRDAQELLLADPIHEVKEEQGWTPEKSSLNEDKEDVARREAKMKK